MFPYPSKNRHNIQSQVEQILALLPLKDFESYTQSYHHCGVKWRAEKMPSLGLCLRQCTTLCCYFSALAESVNLPIVWFYLWRIVVASGLGEHECNAAAVNMTVVTAEVSSARNLWQKNRSLPFIPWTEVFWLILTFSLTTLCRHTCRHTHTSTQTHIPIWFSACQYLFKLPINEALTPKGAFNFYWMTIVPLTCTHSVSIRGETTACSVMNKSQSSIGASKSNISACKFDTMCHNPTHCSHLESYGCRHGNWAFWWKLSTNEILPSL